MGQAPGLQCQLQGTAPGAPGTPGPIPAPGRAPRATCSVSKGDVLWPEASCQRRASTWPSSLGPPLQDSEFFCVARNTATVTRGPGQILSCPRGAWVRQG